ncbi:MAG: hypothetical protein ACFE0P_10485 [Oceanicaulis sp.]
MFSLRTIGAGLAAVLFTGLFSVNAAGQPAEDRRVYSVSAFVYESGELIGAPVLTVREGVTGMLAQGEERGFALEVTVARASTETAARFGRAPLPQEVVLEGRLHFPEQGAWRQIAEPTVLASLDERALVEHDVYARNYRRDGAEDFVDTIKLEFLVTEVDAS